MMTNHQKIASCVERSSLSEQEKNDFLAFLAQTDDAALEPIARMFEENPAQISLLFENYRAKKTAFKNLDQKAWTEIMEREHTALEEVRET